MRRRIRTTLAALAAGVLAALASPAGAAAACDHEDAAGGGRLVVYYQTQYFGGSDGDPGTYVSPLPLPENGATDVIVGAIHLNALDAPNGVVTLNDHAPGHERYDRMWTELAQVRAEGAHVLGMVGGAAPGTFDRLEDDFATYYPLLRDMVTTYGLDGLDLDVEQPMSLAGIERLIDALRADFGADFIITLAPVAPALRGGGNLSGFDYDALYADRGGDIDWFNTQFYCGWGSLASTADYRRIIRHGVVPAEKVVAGTLTNPANCGSGYVDMARLQDTIADLERRYPDFGGISGWEYFNSLPGGTGQPWLWAAAVRSALG